MWFPYSVRMAGTWHAPYGVQVSGNWSIIKPSWSGPIVYRVDRNDPQVLQFGPSTVTSVTGARQSNPLSTRERFCCATRSECQELLPALHQVGVKFAKWISLGATHEVQLAGTILNLFNGGNGFEWAPAERTGSTPAPRFSCSRATCSRAARSRSTVSVLISSTGLKEAHAAAWPAA